MKLKLGIWLFLLITGVGNIVSQVTIGSNKIPEKGALLQLKEIDEPNGVTATTGGLLLPRVILSDKNELYPMFLNTTGTGPNSDYSSNKADLDKAHTGLIVYNLKEDDEKELCLGVNQWDGIQWNCFQNKLGNAVGYIENCDDIKILGQYQNDVSLNSGNYITINLVITKGGAYTITGRAFYAANSSEDNGYFFTATGMFITPGKYTVQIPGGGTPLQYTPTGNPGDYISISMNNKPLSLNDGTTCEQRLFIEDSSKKPLYTMDCGETMVRGVYQIDTPLNPATNFIEMVLNVDPAAIGASYIIETNTVDGIYFKGEGLLNATSQNIKLQGYGTPTSASNKTLTISSNSVLTVTTCQATVVVSLPVKVTYGWGYYQNTAGYLAQPGSGMRKFMDADVNFGSTENSTVKIVKYTSTQTFNHSILSTEGGGNAYSPSQIKSMLDKNPEIIITGFDLALGAADAQTVAGYLVDYLKKGGVLIFTCENATMASALFNALYPNSTISTSGGTASGARVPIPYINDEITNGPFGDIRGKYWGNDASAARAVGLPDDDDLVIYSKASDNRALMLRHKTYNLFFIGDGGVFANISGRTGSNPAGATTTAYPFAIGTNFEPITRTGWVGGDVENSRMFANILAWAVKQAQFNGINK